tara:strand:- start:749 stop:1177 length:429 start_codon:yes stop_codon:yes gene_type:complete
MKNYSDLQAIDFKLDVCIELDPVGTPDIVVEIANNTYANSKLTAPKKLEYQLDLRDIFSINIELKNKAYTLEYDTAVIIQRISIDSIDIVPKFDYLANYSNDHNNNNPTNYLGFNGKWILKFDRPFYQWLHQVTGQGLLVDE